MAKTLHDFPDSERTRNPERKDFKAQLHLADKVYFCCALLLNSDSTCTNMWQVRSWGGHCDFFFFFISVLVQLRWLTQPNHSLPTSKRFAWSVRHIWEMFIFTRSFTVGNPSSCSLGKTQLLWCHWSLSTPLWAMPLTSEEPNTICDVSLKERYTKLALCCTLRIYKTTTARICLSSVWSLEFVSRTGHIFLIK